MINAIITHVVVKADTDVIFGRRMPTTRPCRFSGGLSLPVVTQTDVFWIPNGGRFGAGREDRITAKNN